MPTNHSRAFPNHASRAHDTTGGRFAYGSVAAMRVYAHRSVKTAVGRPRSVGLSTEYLLKKHVLAAGMAATLTGMEFGRVRHGGDMAVLDLSMAHAACRDRRHPLACAFVPDGWVPGTRRPTEAAADPHAS